MAWTIRDDLRLTIRLGLTKGLNLIHGMRRRLSQDERDRVADTIAEHLLRANYRIEPGEPSQGHGPHLMAPKERDGAAQSGEGAGPAPDGGARPLDGTAAQRRRAHGRR